MPLECLMHKLVITKLLHFTVWAENAQNPWLLTNKLVAIQPGISPAAQLRWLNLIINWIC